jgi:parallel beta-helix repeat protein
MRIKKLIMGVLSIFLIGKCYGIEKMKKGEKMDIPIMHICEPEDLEWEKTLPKPEIPTPPKNVGIINWNVLKETAPLEFKGEKEVEAESLKPNGLVKGKGTTEQPYVIKDLYIKVSDKPGLSISNINKPLIIENVCIDGIPIDENTPAKEWGIVLNNCSGVIIKNCQVSRCRGIYAGWLPTQKNIIFEKNYLFSTYKGIMTQGGSHFIARGNYVRDSSEYGIFLWTGTDHIIENNYVAWTGREGVGTNGVAHRHLYQNNVILYSGWTAINVEGENDDTVVRNNLVVDTHYGIILMGNRTLCENNKVFYSSQFGIYIHANDEITVKNNFVIGSSQSGIFIPQSANKTKIISNKIWQSYIGIDVQGKDTLVEKNEIYRFFKGISVSASNCVIRRNSVYRGRNGIWFEGIPETEQGGIVSENYLHHLLAGVVVKKVKSAIFTDNKLESVGQPFPIDNCEELVIKNNKIIQLRYNGIVLYQSSKCNVEENELITGMVEAITLNEGGSHTIKNNIIKNIRGEFSGGGIRLISTKNNTIIDNYLENCAVGVVFDGKNNQNNLLENNKYIKNGINIGLQNGAEEKFDETNKLDTKAISRKQ